MLGPVTNYHETLRGSPHHTSTFIWVCVMFGQLERKSSHIQTMALAYHDKIYRKTWRGLPYTQHLLFLNSCSMLWTELLMLDCTENAPWHSENMWKHHPHLVTFKENSVMCRDCIYWAHAHHGHMWPGFVSPGGNMIPERHNGLEKNLIEGGSTQLQKD